MALVLNTNVASLTAQRNLSQTQNSLNVSLERLSTGLRINSARDDAAGLAISDRMTSQIRGLNQAARNANDGISLAQTAEGALQESTNILQRMRELAVQSANDTNSVSDRASIQREIGTLVSELDRIAQTTEFNGRRVLDGSLNSATFQVGANAGQTITFGIESAKSSSLGQIAQGTGTEVTSAAAADITVQIGSSTAVNVSDSTNYANGTYRDLSSAFAKTEAINDAGITGLTATANTTGTQTVGIFGGSASDTYNLSVNGVAIYTATDVSTALTVNEVRDAINTHAPETGVRASVSGGDLSLTAQDGRNILVTESGTGFVVGTDGISVTGGDFADVLRGQVSLSSSENITLGGTIATLGFTGNITVDTNGIDDVDVTTRAGAETGIQRIDAAIASIDTSRAGLGATQNRFDSTITNLNNVAENLSAARSRILDADFAQETASLTRNQILQQAGLSILAQANQSQQSVLALLG